MTMQPIYKRCDKCGKKYSWNPDVGRIMPVCPYCGGMGKHLPSGKPPDGGLGSLKK